MSLGVILPKEEYSYTISFQTQFYQTATQLLSITGPNKT